MLVCTQLLSACLKEDMSNCPEQIRVYFTFTDIHTLTGEGYPIDPDDVDQMHLYVFSDKGYYLREYRNDRIVKFSNKYYIDCSDLLPGKYRFIAWGGKDENCYSTTPAPFVKNKTNFDEALLILKRAGGNVATPHHLFHSDLPATVTYAKVQRFYMPLLQLTNTINIRTLGLPDDADNYRFNITDNNDAYTFDGSFATSVSDPTFTYTTPCTKDKAGQLNATLRVLRLAENRHKPQLQIYNETADTLLFPTGSYSNDLIGLIQDAYAENDFDTTHIYDIVIVFGNGDNSTGFTFTIFINGWQVREQDGDLTE